MGDLNHVPFAAPLAAGRVLTTPKHGSKQPGDGKLAGDPHALAGTGDE